MYQLEMIEDDFDIVKNDQKSKFAISFKLICMLFVVAT